MSAHVLLNYQTSWGKEIKCEACRVLPLFRNEYIKFNNARARMLDSTYHVTKRLFRNLWRFPP